MDCFEGYIVNVIELTLSGISTIGGRCKFNYILLGGALVLLVELKASLTESLTELSNVVAQVYAEAEGILRLIGSLIPNL